jgi:hypothetical protein
MDFGPLIADPLSLELEEARFGKTTMGGTAVFDAEGYRYLKNRGNKSQKPKAGNLWWRCEYRGGCPGNCVTEGLFIKSKTGTHTHKPGEPVFKDTKKVFRKHSSKAKDVLKVSKVLK